MLSFGTLTKRRTALVSGVYDTPVPCRVEQSRNLSGAVRVQG